LDGCWQYRCRGRPPSGVPIPRSGGVIYYWLAQPRQARDDGFLDAAGKSHPQLSTKPADPSVASRFHSGTASAPPRQRHLRRAVALPPELRPPALKRVGGGSAAPATTGRPVAHHRPRVATRRGPHMFRVESSPTPTRRSFENMILWAAGTFGPIVLPDVYSVSLDRPVFIGTPSRSAS